MNRHELRKVNQSSKLRCVAIKLSSKKLKEVMNKLALDWDTINANRTTWNNRWTREIER